MKLKNILLGLLVAVIAFPGCDKISNPIISTTNGHPPGNTPDFINASDSSYKNYKMLLEIVGGHLCTNCPTGQTDAEAVLSSLIGGQVVFMQDEVGPESSTSPSNIPPSAPAGSFLVDYHCRADSIWYYGIFGTPLVFPYGILNRQGYPHSTFVNYPYQNSCNTIINGHSDTADVSVRIEDSCWTNTNPRFVAANFKLHFNKPLAADTLALETVIVEDSIADWQDSDNHFSPYYMHRNTVRGAFGNDKGGNPAGVNIFLTTKDTTIYQTYDFTGGEYGKAKGWNMEHCRIVAFVYKQNTFQVLQAEMIKIE